MESVKAPQPELQADDLMLGLGLTLKSQYVRQSTWPSSLLRVQIVVFDQQHKDLSEFGAE